MYLFALVEDQLFTHSSLTKAAKRKMICKGKRLKDTSRAPHKVESEPWIDQGGLRASGSAFEVDSRFSHAFYECPTILEARTGPSFPSIPTCVNPTPVPRSLALLQTERFPLFHCSNQHSEDKGEGQCTIWCRRGRGQNSSSICFAFS